MITEKIHFNCIKKFGKIVVRFQNIFASSITKILNIYPDPPYVVYKNTSTNEAPVKWCITCNPEQILISFTKYAIKINAS